MIAMTLGFNASTNDRNKSTLRNVVIKKASVINMKHRITVNNAKDNPIVNWTLTVDRK